MFDHLFENRNTTITNLIKLGDCLGRSLRENVELFTVDSELKKVAYLSESGKVITGEYSLEEDISLEHINIQESDIFTDNTTFDSYVEDKVSTFVGRLNSNSYGEAGDSFSDILTLWENRLKFENVKKHLEEKVTSFSESQTIVNTPQFQRFLEMMPQITKFLSENRDDIQNVQEIENSIKLSNSVSKAFDFPRTSYETLQENGNYVISRELDKSVYELICKQELVKKELLESKKNFEDVWATNPHIRNLASLIFDDSVETVLESLVEAVVEIPYLALATKKQLFESINNAFSLTDNTTITTKELKTYVSKIFEMKKPLKQVIINILNEKYGINVQNLKDAATFSSLANTQVVIFESLGRLAPKGSVIKDTFYELGTLLKSKNGVEVIDVNDVLQECFEVCNYDSFCQDFTLIESMSFENILDDEATAADLLETAVAERKKLLLGKNNKDNEDLSPEQRKAKKDCEDHEAEPDEHDLEDDSERISREESPDFEDGDDNKKKKKKKGDDEKKDTKDVKEQTEMEAPVEAPEEEVEEEGAPEAQPITKDSFLNALKDMDEVLKGMSPEEEEEEVDTAETDEREA